MRGKRILMRRQYHKEEGRKISELTLEYLNEKISLNKSRSTVKSISDTLQKWMRYTGDITTTDINQVDHVQSFSLSLLDEGLKPASVNHYLRDIRSFLYWLMEREYCERFTVHMVEEQENIIRTYTDEEKKRLLVKPKSTDGFLEWRSWAVVSWILATGNRAGTVVSIRMSDISISKREIYISHSKTKRAQIIPMSTALSNVLREYIREWRSNASDEQYLFPSITEEQLSAHGLGLSIRSYNRRRGVQKTSVHAFRHTFARDWVVAGGDVFRLQRLLGHSTLEMTRHYVNLFSEDLAVNFDTYNPLDNIKRTTTREKRVRKNR